ncbi:MAG: undecaprenyl-phosphate glucose phosphotransferase [Hyphomicrobiaceae bacterium]
MTDTAASDSVLGTKPRLVDLATGRTSSFISPEILTDLVRAGEFALTAVAGFAVFETYVNSTGFEERAPYLVVASLAGLAVIVAFAALRLYGVSAFTQPIRLLPRLWLGWTIVFAFLTAAAFFLKVGPEFSRVWLLTWYAAGGIALLAGRIVLAQAVSGWLDAGRLQRRAVIIGGGEPASALIRALESDRSNEIRICGIFDDRTPERLGTAAAGYPHLGTIDDLVEFGRKSRVDMLIVSLPMHAENRLLQVFRKLWVLPVDIRLSAHMSKLNFRPRAYSYIGSVPFIDIADRPIANWSFILKWLFDKTIALLALIALAPVMLAVAAAVRFDSRGPVLFRQKRFGFNNELIEVFKFRSMYVDQSDADAARLVTRGDPRVTRVGRFIRKTSLDELPQLFNVLTGQLSLVGPRPHALQAKAADRLYQDVVDGYYARHKVKPGLTGWAQINGWRGETDTAEKIQRRVEHDLYYIENWSVFLDLYILFMTPFALLKAENAY